MKRAAFADIQSVRVVFPHADKGGRFTVFNVGGNKVRLVAAIHYNRGKV
jgi:mRNA interferase HigB